MLETINEGRARASSVENKVASIFESRGWSVERADWHQEVKQDIDLIVTKGERRLTISVKAQEAGLAYGHVYVELNEGVVDSVYQTWEQDDSYAKRLVYADGRWILVRVRPSWFHNGRADYYAIVQGDELILIRKSVLEQIVKRELDKPRPRILELSQALRDRAVRGGHPAIWNQSLYMDRGMVKRYAEVISLVTNKEERKTA